MSARYVPLNNTDFNHEVGDNAWKSKTTARKAGKVAPIALILLVLISNIATILHFSSLGSQSVPAPQSYGNLWPR